MTRRVRWVRTFQPLFDAHYPGLVYGYEETKRSTMDIHACMAEILDLMARGPHPPGDEFADTRDQLIERLDAASRWLKKGCLPSIMDGRLLSAIGNLFHTAAAQELVSVDFQKGDFPSASMKDQVTDSLKPSEGLAHDGDSDKK